MSRPIAESLSLLSETLGNCKTNLKEKSVEDVDNIKISDVDEKIAEIKSGGGEPDKTRFTLNSVTFNGDDITSLNNQSTSYSFQKTGDLVFDYTYDDPWSSTTYLILIKKEQNYSATISTEDIKTGNNSITISNVSTAGDAGTCYIALFCNYVDMKYKLVFSVKLYNDESDW